MRIQPFARWLKIGGDRHYTPATAALRSGQWRLLGDRWQPSSDVPAAPTLNASDKPTLAEKTVRTIILWFNTPQEEESGDRENSQLFGHAHQVGDGAGFHLFHYAGALDFDCDFSSAQFGGGLFVEQPRDDKRHDLPFAWCQ